jgi:hypothetical protein
MTLAQVQAFVAGVFALIASWASLMMAVSLLLPAHSRRAEQALISSAKRCFLYGVGMVLLFIVAIALVRIPNPLIRLIGLCILLGLGATMAIGAAGLAQLMGRRIGALSGAKTSFGALVQGSLIFSFALLFPLIGWWVFAPLAGILSLGAGVTGLLSREWIPSSANVAVEGQGAA